jgi:hypothetical protein
VNICGYLHHSIPSQELVEDYPYKLQILEQHLDEEVILYKYIQFTK